MSGLGILRCGREDATKRTLEDAVENVRALGP